MTRYKEKPRKKLQEKGWEDGNKFARRTMHSDVLQKETWLFDGLQRRWNDPWIDCWKRLL